MVNPLLTSLRYICPYFGRVYSNFHIVDSELTRSAQLTKSQLENVINEFKIKTFVSLRPERPEKKWFREEKELLLERDIPYMYLGLDAQKFPSEIDVQKIKEVISQSSRPIHVQCRGGADRTGLFCGLYLLEKGASFEDVIKQVSIYYGNFVRHQRDYFNDLKRTPLKK